MVTKFPGNLFETRITDSVSLICAMSGEEVLSQLDSGDSYTIIQVPMLSGIKFLALKGFKIMEPRPARSEGSKAVYLAKAVNKRDGLLLQYLPAHSPTSAHYHEQTTERFHWLAGNAMIYTPGGFFDFTDRRTITINPSTHHQVRTAGEDSLVLLEMIAPPGVGMDDHFYVDPTQWPAVRLPR